MEKLEKHIKQKLQERKISPSVRAWEKIEASLEPEKKRKGGYWYAVAASLIGLLIASIVFFSSQNNVEPAIEIVDVEKESVVKEMEKVNSTEIVETTSSMEKNNSLPQEKDFSTGKKNTFKENVVEKNTVIVSAEEVPEKQELIIANSVATKSQDLIINQKVSEVLATVINLESESLRVTDAEVDSLLRIAQHDILEEKVFQDDGKVDAMALLSEVETELDQTFRDKIFAKLKEGLFKARTAVADRNQ